MSNIICELFTGMNLSPGKDSDSLAMSWLEKHNKAFFGFCDGHSLQKEDIKANIKSEVISYKINDSFTGKHLYDVFIASDNHLLAHTSRNSALGFKAWSCMSGFRRSKVLYKVAQSIEKYQQLFSVIESVSSGKQLHKVKTKDIPNLIQAFYYYAGCALELQEESKSWFPIGPVCVVAEEYNNPSISLSLRVTSLLASGNSILLLADVKSCLSAFLLAEICVQSGIPSGVLNVLPIDQEKFKIGENIIFSKLIFVGSLERSSLYSKLSGEAHIPCEVLVPRRPTVIVYESADLYAAADGVLEAFCYHDTRSKSGGCKLMIQESIATKFMKILDEAFSKILVGKNLSKTDLSCIVTEKQKLELPQYIKEAEAQGGKIILKTDITDCEYCYMDPTFISNVVPNFKLVHEELGGPIIVTVLFRTIKESISMFNCDNKGSPVSIWTEKNSVAMEVAHKLKSGVIQLNSQNLVDTSVPFTGVYLSGNSVEGGKDAFFNNLSTCEAFTFDDENRSSDIEEKYKTWLSSVNEIYKSASNLQGISENMKEYKLYIGGALKRSDSGTVQIGKSTLISNGSEADVVSAISSAVAAQSKWESFSKYQRRQVLLSVAECLEGKKQEIISECSSSEASVGNGEEINEALDILYFWALQSDKCGSQTEEIPRNVKVIQDRHPLGVIGIQCPNEKPLLAFLSLVAPAVMSGNTVVAIASEKFPILILKMGEIFSLSGVPSGIVNIISGSSHRLVPCLCKSMDVNAVWFTDVPSKVIYTNCYITQKIFDCKGIWKDFNEAKKLKCVMASTYTKAVFLPMGEIFAN